MKYDGLSKMGYGMYLVSAGGNALLANLAMQVASDPATLCVSISKANHTHQLIQEGGKFNVSVLTQKAELPFLTRFGFKSGRDQDKLQDVQWEDFGGVKTVTQHCNAAIACEVQQAVDCGDATVFFGKIVDSRALSPEPSMSCDHYQAVVEGRVSKKSPAFTARYVK